MARKSKYDADSFPLLAEQYARQGLSDKQIGKNLGVSLATYYKFQKEYPEFLNAVKRGKLPCDIQVENAMFKAACGYEYEELTEEGEVHIVDGVETFVVTRRKRITKQVQPNATLAIFWSVNRQPERWRNILNIEHSGSIDTIAAFVSAAKKRLEEQKE